MKKILVVTGGAGFVGSNLIEYLITETKYDIISLDNYSSGEKKNHIKSLRFYSKTSQNHAKASGLSKAMGIFK